MMKKLDEMQKAFDVMSTEQVRLRKRLNESVVFKIEGATYKPGVNGTYFVDRSKGRVNGKPVWKKRCDQKSEEYFVFLDHLSYWMITNNEKNIKESKGHVTSKKMHFDFPFDAKEWKNNSKWSELKTWVDDNDIKITEVKTYAALSE